MESLQTNNTFSFTALMQEDDISLDLQCNDFSFMCGLLLPEIENDTQIPSPTEASSSSDDDSSYPFFSSLIPPLPELSPKIENQIRNPVANNYGPLVRVPVVPPVSSSYHPDILPMNNRIKFSSLNSRLTLQTDSRLYETIEKDFIPNPTEEQKQGIDTKNFYLRWVMAPPERVHATSPAKLVSNPRPGAPFKCSVQLCVHNPSINKYLPYEAETPIKLYASIFGKRKPKTGAGRTHYNDYYMRRSDYVKLINNPVGKPLLVCGDSGIIETIIKKGESKASFDSLSLTCGSNAARSRKALPAARGWDWDYHLMISTDYEGICMHSLMSKQLTTDSNRSQTREKRKLSELDGIESAPEPKKRKISNTIEESDSSPQSNSEN